jgi:hypothetical protein
MIYRKNLHTVLPIFLPFLLLVLSACEKFTGDQSIPAYISVDSITLQINDPAEGSASSSITDAWVYIDENLIGTFQLPARFPVLSEGKHRLTIIPGIKKDGIGSTRVTYPFYSMITRDVNLVPDSTTNVGWIKTTYESTTKFIWQENFEDVAISMDSTRQSSVPIELTSDSLTFEGLHSGMIRMDTANSFFEIVTHNKFTIPVGVPIYLEMNFNTNNAFNVGVFVYLSGYLIYQVPIITLVPTNNSWKKIYIDLSVTLNSYAGAEYFKVYLGNFKDPSIDKAVILFDNFKLVTR